MLCIKSIYFHVWKQTLPCRAVVGSQQNWESSYAQVPPRLSPYRCASSPAPSAPTSWPPRVHPSRQLSLPPMLRLWVWTDASRGLGDHWVHHYGVVEQCHCPKNLLLSFWGGGEYVLKITFELLSFEGAPQTRPLDSSQHCPRSIEREESAWNAREGLQPPSATIEGQSSNMGLSHSKFWERGYFLKKVCLSLPMPFFQIQRCVQQEQICWPLGGSVQLSRSQHGHVC